MVSKDTVITLARLYLEAVADEARKKLGVTLKRLERRVCNIRTGPGQWRQNTMERRVVDTGPILRMCESPLGGMVPLGMKLEEALTGAGIPTGLIKRWYLKALVAHWLNLPTPFAFEEKSISHLLKEFAQAVIDGTVITKSRDAFASFELAAGALPLQEGVCIRPISEEELWEFGAEDSFPIKSGHITIPSDDWAIFHIEIERNRDDNITAQKQINAIRQAVLPALVLASKGQFTFVPLAMTTTFGTAALGRMLMGGAAPREIGHFRPDGYVVDEVAARRLRIAYKRILASFSKNRQL